MASTALVTGADRLIKCFGACLNPAHVGAANRGVMDFDDNSLGFLIPTKQDGSGPEYPGVSIGYWVGVAYWLGGLGLLWGLNATNYTNSTFGSANALGSTGGAQDFASDPGANPGFILNRSVAWTGVGQAGASVGLCGPLHYVDAARVYPAALTFSPARTITATATLGSGNWPLSFLIGNPTTDDFNFHYSYATDTGWTGPANVGCYIPFSGFQLAQKTISVGTAQAMVDDYLIVPANASTGDREFQLYATQTWNDSGGATGGTKGPILFSGIMPTHKSIKTDLPLTGKSGFAVSVWYAHGGYTGTQVNSECAAIGVGPRAEYMRAVTGNNSCRAKYFLNFWCLLGHDIVGTHNSFRPSDTGVADSHDPASITSTGPIESSGAGVVQNLSTHVQQDLAAWVTTLGRDPADYKCIAGFYHSNSTVLAVQQAAEQAIADAITAATDPNMAYVILVRGTKAVTPTEIFNNVWYNGPAQSDTPHFDTAGFLGFPARCMNALFQAFQQASGGGSSTGISGPLRKLLLGT